MSVYWTDIIQSYYSVPQCIAHTQHFQFRTRQLNHKRLAHVALVCVGPAGLNDVIPGDRHALRTQSIVDVFDDIAATHVKRHVVLRRSMYCTQLFWHAGRRWSVTKSLGSEHSGVIFIYFVMWSVTWIAMPTARGTSYTSSGWWQQRVPDTSSSEM